MKIRNENVPIVCKKRDVVGTQEECFQAKTNGGSGWLTHSGFFVPAFLSYCYNNRCVDLCVFCSSLHFGSFARSSSCCVVVFAKCFLVLLLLLLLLFFFNYNDEDDDAKAALNKNRANRESVVLVCCRAPCLFLSIFINFFCLSSFVVFSFVHFHRWVL